MTLHYLLYYLLLGRHIPICVVNKKQVAFSFKPYVVFLVMRYVGPKSSYTVYSEQLCGRVRRKSDEQEGFVNGRCFKAIDMVLRDMLLEEEAFNTRGHTSI